jgi:hypothetical protein
MTMHLPTAEADRRARAAEQREEAIARELQALEADATEVMDAHGALPIPALIELELLAASAFISRDWTAYADRYTTLVRAVLTERAAERVAADERRHAA